MKKYYNIFACFLFACAAEATTLNGTQTITPANINLINVTETLLIGKTGDITFSGVNLQVDVGTTRYSMMNAGKVNVTADSVLEFISDHTSTGVATTYAGEMTVSGTVTFWQTTAPTTSSYPLWLGYDYTFGGVNYTSAPMIIKNGGVVKVCATATANTFGRTRVMGTSSLTIEGGGSFYTQSLELYDKAVVTFGGANSGFYNSTSKTASPFIILFKDTARGGPNVTVNFADGFELKGNSIIFQDTVKAHFYLDDVKNSNLKLTTFRSYQGGSTTNSSEFNFYNFANDYIILTDTANMIKINEDGTIGVTALTGSYIDQKCAFIAYVDGVGSDSFSDGWYLEEIDGVGYYLNNTNFIPEPAHFALGFGLAALALAFLRRRGK